MEVIHYFLIFLVINLGVLYWFQRSVLSGQPSTVPSNSEQVLNNFGANGQKELPADCNGRLDCIRSCQGGSFVNNKCRLAGLAGPVTGFHQSFKPSVGRELGWRSYFIRKFGGVGTCQQAANDDGLQGSLTQNYLSTLPNTDNIYRQTDY
jgi:hypothetical protein